MKLGNLKTDTVTLTVKAACFETWCLLIRHNFYFQGEWCPFMICTAPLRISLPLSSWLATDKLASSKQTIGNCCNLLATKAVKRIVLVLHLLQLISPSQRQKTTAANRTITFFLASLWDHASAEMQKYKLIILNMFLWNTEQGVVGNALDVL